MGLGMIFIVCLLGKCVWLSTDFSCLQVCHLGKKQSFYRKYKSTNLAKSSMQRTFSRIHCPIMQWIETKVSRSGVIWSFRAWHQFRGVLYLSSKASRSWDSSCHGWSALHFCLWGWIVYHDWAKQVGVVSLNRSKRNSWSHRIWPLRIHAGMGMWEQNFCPRSIRRMWNGLNEVQKVCLVSFENRRGKAE